MGVESIFLAALLLAIPSSARYVTAFGMRALQDQLRERERAVEIMLAHLKGLRHEELITRRAAHQVTEQRRWAGTRRQIMATELERVRQPVQVSIGAEPEFEPQVTPEWTPEGLGSSVESNLADRVSTAAAEAEV